MEAAEGTELSACLLQWVKSFDSAGHAHSLAELNDGLTLWNILRQVDPDYFTGDLPEPGVTTSTDWTRKWQNLKHVEKQLATYYRDVCNEQEQVDAGSVPDLKAVAAEQSERDLQKLIMTIIRAAMASPESNQKMAQRLMSLGRENAMVIANELRSMEDVEYVDDSEPVSRDESAYQSEQETTEEPKTNGSKTGDAAYQDPLLEREEELLQAQAIIDRLQASQSSALQQLQELRQDKDRLQAAFDAYRSEIETKGRKTGGDDAYKKLQRQADNDRAYIDDLENQLQSSRNAIENYERQVQKQRDETDQSQKLRDDLQLLRADNDDLNQKIRANENLKKKIQTLQEQEKANASLREELKQANERLDELDRLKQIQAGLEKEIIEKKGLIRNQEYQITELTTTRKHAEYDARTLAQKLQEARDRHDRDHDAIEELRAKLRESNLDDTTTTHDEDTLTESKAEASAEPERRVIVPTNDENKHLVEKVAMLEEQLESADARLRQASKRSAALEERNQSSETDAEAQRKVEQRVQEHESTIAELRKQLETKKSKPDVPASSQDIATLQRENHLMTTAWYDLSTRLQNNGVSLGRRRQEPKSWIGKQRALVGPGSGLVR